MANLSAQLKAALESGGPSKAIKVCQQVAKPITESTSGQFDDITISRTSLRFRNPRNAPDETDRRILEAWQMQVDEGNPLPAHELVSIDRTTARYYQPIMLKAMCLNCHGSPDSFATHLKSQLTDLYPNDKATGYAEGDLRGAFRATIHIESTPLP